MAEYRIRKNGETVFESDSRADIGTEAQKHLADGPVFIQKKSAEPNAWLNVFKVWPAALTDFDI